MNFVPTIHRAKKLAIHIGPDAGSHVKIMLARQNLNGQTSSQRDFLAGAVGCLGGTLPAIGNVCFFSGAPINGPNISEIVNADAAKRLFPEYDGAFTGIFLDTDRQILVVVTDCLGMQPLYMRHVDDELTLVSETKAMRGDPDLAAWGAFISIGHPIGERSLMKDLARVPAASILTYDIAQRRLEIQRYWHWPEPSNAWRDYDFLSSLENDIHGYAALGNPGTLLLSGGFDSRLLLFLLERAGIPTNTLIVAHEDEHRDADGRLAEAVVALVGNPSRKVSPPQDFFSSLSYVDYLSASDAGFPSLDLFIAKVASQIDSTAVWDGLVPGFVFMPLHQSEGGFDDYLRKEIRGLDSAIWRVAKTLFKREVVEAMHEGFVQDLRDEISRLQHDSYGLARFVIEHRSRNRASMNPLKVYSNQTDAFIPGLSKDFMTHAAIIPYEEKRDGLFYRRLFLQLDKRSLTIPFLSGGELIKGAGFNSAYCRELLRNAFYKQLALHPSLFPIKSDTFTHRSTFLGSHLFDNNSEWLDPKARERLSSVNTHNYATWKLLFHWKVWQLLHEGNLEKVLKLHANHESYK